MMQACPTFWYATSLTTCMLPCSAERSADTNPCSNTSLPSCVSWPGTGRSVKSSTMWKRNKQAGLAYRLPWPISTRTGQRGEQRAAARTESPVGQRRMIVVDASVLANALADDDADGRLARGELRAAGELTAPDLIDVETVSVLRKRWLRGTLTDDRLNTAVTHLLEMTFERVPTRRLVRRAIELRDNVSAYDACYVALAESLQCDLLTADRRLAAAHGPRCTIRVLQ
jgi:predicted nucleic acid-binding protein